MHLLWTWLVENPVIISMIMIGIGAITTGVSLWAYFNAGDGSKVLLAPAIIAFIAAIIGVLYLLFVLPHTGVALLILIPYLILMLLMLGNGYTIGGSFVLLGLLLPFSTMILGLQFLAQTHAIGLFLLYVIIALWVIFPLWFVTKTIIRSRR